MSLWGPELASWSGGSADNRPRYRTSASSSSSASRLDDYRRLHSLNVSDDAFKLIYRSWRTSSTKRYDAVWSCFKDFLSRRRLGLDLVSVNIIIEYIAWLFQEGRQYKTICVHRSVLSSMFPTMDGHSVGSHPTISRAMQGIFNERPPSRRMFESWNVSKVFDALPPPSSLKDAQKRCAFLLAMASSRRPSEIASRVVGVVIWR